MLAVPIPGDATARTARDVAAEALVAGLEVITCESVEDALREIAQIDVRPARVLICGSLHLAGHVLALEEGVEAQMN
jgi:dihydrofolate synthase/folylpolyglutamate synthase